MSHAIVDLRSFDTAKENVRPQRRGYSDARGLACRNSDETVEGALVKTESTQNEADPASKHLLSTGPGGGCSGIDDLNSQLSARMAAKAARWEDALLAQEHLSSMHVKAWLTYIRWAESEPRMPTARLRSLYSRCTREFSVPEAAQHFNNRELVRLWAKFADSHAKPTDVFLFMDTRGIGAACAAFYVAWSWVAEARHDFTEATRIFSLGVARGAQPLDQLERYYSSFRERIERRVAALPAEEAARSGAERTLAEFAASAPRTVLGQLTAEAALTSNRLASDRATGLRTSANNSSFPDRRHQQNSSGAAFSVHKADFRNIEGMAITNIWDDETASNENAKAPSTWDQPLSKPRHVPEARVVQTATFAVLSDHSGPGNDSQSSTVFSQQNQERQPQQVKQAPTRGAFPHPLVAGPITKNSHGRLERFAYDPQLITASTGELQFEELRAAAWFASQKKQMIQETESVSANSSVEHDDDDMMMTMAVQKTIRIGKAGQTVRIPSLHKPSVGPVSESLPIHAADEDSHPASAEVTQEFSGTIQEESTAAILDIFSRFTRGDDDDESGGACTIDAKRVIRNAVRGAQQAANEDQTSDPEENNDEDEDAASVYDDLLCLNDEAGVDLFTIPTDSDVNNAGGSESTFAVFSDVAADLNPTDTQVAFQIACDEPASASALAVAVDGYSADGMKSVDPFVIRHQKELLEREGAWGMKNLYDLRSQAPPSCAALSNKKAGNLNASRRVSRFGDVDLELEHVELDIEECLGEGAYAKVYRVQLGGTFSVAKGGALALKVANDEDPWEFFVCKRIAERLSSDAILRFSQVRSMHVYQGRSYLLMETVSAVRNQGTLQDVINAYALSGASVPEPLAVFFTLEIVRLVQTLHTANFLHGDIKPDNFLVKNNPTSSSNDLVTDDYWESMRWNERGLILIDFGRAIDLELYERDQTFSNDNHVDGFKCPAMLAGRPWRHEIDIFGIAATAHCLLHGKYMELDSVVGTDRWVPHLPLKRYHTKTVWEVVFDKCINVAFVGSAAADPLAVLRELRQTLTRHITADETRSREIRSELARLQLKMAQSRKR